MQERLSPTPKFFIGFATAFPYSLLGWLIIFHTANALTNMYIEVTL